MALDPIEAMALRARVPVAWDARDVILYALGVSALTDPLDHRQLRLVCEPELRVLPTFWAALARTAAPSVADLGGDYERTVLVAQSLEVHQPLLFEGEALAESRVVDLEDRGPGRGTLITVSTVLKNAQEEPLVTVAATQLIRGEAAPGAASPRPSPRSAWRRPPDERRPMPIRADQALLYRLSGDLNPLHWDPAAAKARGFPQPILHGLCTYGFAARAVLDAFGDLDPKRLTSHFARFTGPVYPGETLRIDLWRDGPDVTFEAHVVERGARVLSDGRSHLLA